MDIDLAEKKRRRLERNRESARECRKRKKEKKLKLRQQLTILEAENLQLRLRLQIGHDSRTQEDKSADITSRLDKLIKEGGSEADIRKAIGELQEKYADYGRDRKSAIDFHINQLRRCLLPTQTTRAILWLMSLAPKYHHPITGEIQNTDSSEACQLWFDLLNEVKPSIEQRKVMMTYTAPDGGSKDPFIEVNETTTDCNQMLDRLVEIVCNKNESLDNEMANLQTILSPRQIAKFILWIDQNPACMQMLEALWPHFTISQSPNNGKRTRDGGKVTNSNNNSVGNEDDDDDDDSSTGSDSK